MIAWTGKKKSSLTIQYNINMFWNSSSKKRKRFYFILYPTLLFVLYKLYRKYCELEELRKRFYYPPKSHILWRHWPHFYPGHEPSEWLLENSVKGGNWMFFATPFYAEIVLSRPEDVQIACKKDLPKPLPYSMMEKWLGKGLLLNHGNDWKQKRRLLTPSFHFDTLKQWCKVFTKNTLTLMDIFRNHAERDEEFDIQIEASLLSLDNIGETAMGVSFNALRNRHSDFVMATKDISILMLKKILNPIYALQFLYSLTSDGRKADELITFLHSKSLYAIEKRKKELEDPNISVNQKYFMDILLTGVKEDDNEKLTLEEIRAEVDTFMFEGHDTTSSGLMWILYDLATNQQVQNSLYQELIEAYGDNQPFDFQPDYDEIGPTKLKYLNKVICESNRLHPPVPDISKNLLEDTFIAGTMIPKGSIINIAVRGLHLQPDIYPNPTVFDPERFSDELKDSRHPFAYIPFSAGPRNCVGQNFAMTEMRVVIVMLIYHFEFTSINQAKPMTELVLRNDGPLLLKVKSRSRSQK